MGLHALLNPDPADKINADQCGSGLKNSPCGLTSRELQHGFV
jgi:hypothetical protein